MLSLKSKSSRISLRKATELAPILARGFADIGHPSTIRTIEDVDAAIKKLVVAQKEFSRFSQAKVDEIFERAAVAANLERLTLAKMAVKETELGLLEDKVIKNHFAAEYVIARHRNTKSCGVIEENEMEGKVTVAEPVGPIASILPTTNPTSTAIIKSLFALKTRNAMIMLPHPRAEQCTNYTTQLIHQAAVAAGAPENVLMCCHSNKEISEHILTHPDIKFILATGGPSMVHHSYSVGKPAIGVGSGNAPVLIDETADLEMAVASIVIGKTFDNGTTCPAEQAVVVVDEVYDHVVNIMKKRGVYIVDGEDKDRLRSIILKEKGGHRMINPDIVGQSAQTLAKMAGIAVPKDALVLAGEVDKVGDDEPLSFEKLSPIIALYRVKDFDHGVDVCVKFAAHGGSGHTAAMYTSEDNTMKTKDGSMSRLEKFELAVPANHVIVNMPNVFGAIGGVYNYSVEPSLTLGVGSTGGGSTSVNLGPMSLVNMKIVTERRDHIEWFKLPKAIYYNRYCIRDALKDCSLEYANGVKDKRALIITDMGMVNSGVNEKVSTILQDEGLQVETFCGILPDPCMATVREGVAACERFKPDIIVAVGGGSPMDAAKMIRFFYEHPEYTLQDLTVRFIEIRHRTIPFPRLGSKVHKLLAIPTTSGTGAEMTPFAVITGDDHKKYPVCSYSLTPDVAILDAQFVDSMPRKLAAFTGYDTLVHAIESYVSTYASRYTQPLSLEAVSTIGEHLVPSVTEAKRDSREKMHNAAAIAGMAFGNAFLGICHSMSHQLGAEYHIPHGLANALLLSHVIDYNATECPTKIGIFSQYKYPVAIKRYAEVADALGAAPHQGVFLQAKDGKLGEGVDPTMEAKVVGLLVHLEKMKGDLGMSLSIKDELDAQGVTEEQYLAAVPRLAEQAFDDQCTGTNPRYPIITELVELYTAAYYGPPARIASADDAWFAANSHDGATGKAANE